MNTLRLEYVKVNHVHPNPWNPHATTEEEMDSLVESIGVNGMMDAPLVVEWDADLEYEGKMIAAKPGAYLIVDGEQKTTAYRHAFMRGLLDSTDIPVLILGKLSEFGKERLAELGQVLNHKGRGSLEDEKKTGVILQWMLKNKPIDQVAKTVGQREDFLKRSLATLAASQKNQAPLSNAARQSASVAAPNGGRPEGYMERKALNVVLPFEDELAVSEFENLVSLVMTTMDASELPNTRGSKRVSAVMEALRNYERDILNDFEE